nr:histidine--tRNA ligase [Anaerolineae bacterium]
MTEKSPARIPAGMRDILPAQMIKRQYVLDVVREVFEEFGFEPLQTSAIELSDTLLGKYGPDAERLIYKAWYGDSPDGEFALRYDLSVPLSRVIAMYPDLPRPFKRYQIAPVWRADRPQKGRYREFYQCDVDVVGTESMLADAEIIAVVYEALNRLGFRGVTISINNRKLLNGIGQYAGVPEGLQPGLYRSIDKLDKIGLDGVRRELLMVGVPTDYVPALQRTARLALQGKIPQESLFDGMVNDERLPEELVRRVLDPLTDLVEDASAEQVPGNMLQAVSRDIVQELAPQLRDFYGLQEGVIPSDVVKRLLELLQITGEANTVLDNLGGHLADYPQAVEGIAELRDLFAYLAMLGIPSAAYALNFAMVRGLEYYTGPIFETTITEPKAMPSITGGGRYDELIGLFADTSYPATGTSLGIERIIDAMDELDMFPVGIRSSVADVLVTIFDPSTQSESLRLATKLRKTGVKTSLYYDPLSRLGDQIGYASATGIPFVIILGPDEIAQEEATIRRLGDSPETSVQLTVKFNEVAQTILNW